MPTGTEEAVRKSLSANFGDWVIKILAGLVVPVIVWGVSLEARLSTQNLRVAQLEDQVRELKPNTVALVKLEEQVKNVNTTLTEIKSLLNRPVVP